MEKIRLLLYCTKNKKQKDLLWSNDLKYFFLDGVYNRLIDDLPKYLLNGKIVAECDFEVEEIKHQGIGLVDLYETSLSEEDLCYLSCLTDKELHNYLNGKNGYAIHIKNLNVFDKPRELNNYMARKVKKDFFNIGIITSYDEIKNAPQNMMYCYGNNIGEKYILISIRPEYLVKILNKEKTIEIRKKVLKEMINNA